MVSVLGRTADVQHDRHASRLVHLAPARLGRTDCGLLLRIGGEPPHRKPGLRPCGAPVPGPSRRSLLRETGGMLRELSHYAVENLFFGERPPARFAIEDHNRYAPGALARDA